MYFQGHFKDVADIDYCTKKKCTVEVMLQSDWLLLWLQLFLFDSKEKKSTTKGTIKLRP